MTCPVPALNGLEFGNIGSLKRAENGARKSIAPVGRSMVGQSVFPWRFITIRLQPQMKKYRCLWGLSTTNHNILYFVRIPGTRPLNARLCLWKAQTALRRVDLEG
jgi:hypothetical protein